MDQPLPDEVGGKHNERNCLGQALEERPADASDEDDVRLRGDDPLSQRFEAGGVFRLPVNLDIEVIAFDIVATLS